VVNSPDELIMGTEVAVAFEALLQSGAEECMAVSQELLDILVCPLDKTPVKLTPDKQGLKCPKCHRVYPIRDDIPVMLVDEARIEAQ
jgi:uncharacterized protein YbaR (Trm112 family)